jgi:hypothetical protein
MTITPSGTSAGYYRSGLMQIIEAQQTIPERGRSVTFQCRVAMATGTQNFRCAIIEWVGTADTFAAADRNPVGTWSSATYTKNNFFTNDAGYATIAGANISSQVSVGTSYTDVTLTYSVSSSANNLLIFIWKDADNGDAWNITKCALYDGTSTHAWLPRPLALELARCQRRYQSPLITYADMATGPGAANGGVYIAFPVQMASTPTIVVVGNATAWSCTNCTVPGTTTISTFGFGLAAYSASGGRVIFTGDGITSYVTGSCDL